MTTYEFGDVVVVDFPFTNQTGFKPRPAVVVSRAEYNSAKPDVVLMPITSQRRQQSSFPDVWLTGWLNAGLRKPSAVKPVFMTIEQTMIRASLSKLDDADREALRSALLAILPS